MSSQGRHCARWQPAYSLLQFGKANPVTIAYLGGRADESPSRGNRLLGDPRWASLAVAHETAPVPSSGRHPHRKTGIEVLSSDYNHAADERGSIDHRVVDAALSVCSCAAHFIQTDDFIEARFLAKCGRVDRLRDASLRDRGQSLAKPTAYRDGAVCTRRLLRIFLVETADSSPRRLGD
jgi:hypothetical protein